MKHNRVYCSVDAVCLSSCSRLGAWHMYSLESVRLVVCSSSASVGYKILVLEFLSDDETRRPRYGQSGDVTVDDVSVEGITRLQVAVVRDVVRAASPAAFAYQRALQLRRRLGIRHPRRARSGRMIARSALSRHFDRALMSTDRFVNNLRRCRRCRLFYTRSQHHRCLIGVDAAGSLPLAPHSFSH